MSKYKQAAELRAVFPVTFACIRPHNSRCMHGMIFYITFSFAFNDLMKLVDAVEYIEERFEQLDADRRA